MSLGLKGTKIKFILCGCESADSKNTDIYKGNLEYIPLR